MSYESKTATWLLQDGWEVLLPIIDHGLKTDVVKSDGHSFYRIQVKSLETTWVENKGEMLQLILWYIYQLYYKQA
ncbi:group I intron-associated PD-(D/E)XK endonuclease [Agarivorans sp. B2Z047]|uniref:group I intron-associated PD-(D/E)XK endonuclease n=1 Tax=Agarivorans sp. B2Z047 TaxID=2652721 RepID=UPI001883BE06